MLKEYKYIDPKVLKEIEDEDALLYWYVLATEWTKENMEGFYEGEI